MSMSVRGRKEFLDQITGGQRTEIPDIGLIIYMETEILMDYVMRSTCLEEEKHINFFEFYFFLCAEEFIK